jgi:hypothetical protein
MITKNLAIFYLLNILCYYKIINFKALKSSKINVILNPPIKLRAGLSVRLGRDSESSIIKMPRTSYSMRSGFPPEFIRFGRAGMTD